MCLKSKDDEPVKKILTRVNCLKATKNLILSILGDYLFVITKDDLDEEV